MRTATKTNRKKLSILRIVRFTLARDTFVSTTQKKKNEKKWKKFKKVSKWLGAPSRPPSPTKQGVWRRYQTGLSEVMSVFVQNLVKNDAFYLQVLMRNLV